MAGQGCQDKRDGHFQNLKGFLRIRPVFLRSEFTFESSFFGSVFEVVFAAAGTAAFLEGTAAGCLTGAGLRSSGAGFGSSSAGAWITSEAVTSGVGFTSGAGIVVLAALAGMSIPGAALRCMET